MKTVSSAYKADMKALIRDRSYVKVAFSNIDTTAAADGDWVSNGAESYSEFDTVDYKYAYGDAYASLELNRWALDGTIDIIPSTPGNDGFVSSLISGEGGTFTTIPTLTREFTSAHTFLGITLTFDTRIDTWPQSVTAYFYLSDTLVDTETVEDIQEPIVIVNTTATSVDKIILELGTTLPYHRPRIERIMFGVFEEFTNTEIVSTTQSHDVDPLSRRLPSEKFSFTILDYEHNYDPDNPTGIYAYVDAKSPVSIQFGYTLSDGSIEWVKPDQYILTGKPTVAKEQATFNATGLIGSHSGSYYKGVLGLKNFYDMAVDVLTDANLGLTESGENPWDIDDSLADMYTTAALPIDSHMNNLQRIAHACRGRFYTDDDNVIHIKPFGVTVSGIYSGTWADNGHEDFSEWLTIDKGNTATNTYATLELNRWALDGTQTIVPSESPSGRGFVSDIMSGSAGTFLTNPVVSKTFNIEHDLPVVALRFDDLTDECPIAVYVTFYKGAIVLDSQFISGLSSPELYISSSLALDCDKIEVTATSTLPYRRFRISRVYFRETDFSLNFATIKQGEQSLSKIDKLKDISVARYYYTPADSATTLYEETTTDEALHVEFGLAQDVSISVVGGTLLTSSIYAQAADLTLSAGTKTVTITGKSLSETAITVTKHINSDGEDDTEENHLITNETMRAALSDHIAAYLGMRNTYDVTYRGNPEIETGDIIGTQTKYTDDMDAFVLTDEIAFSGALSGKMKVKALI